MPEADYIPIDPADFKGRVSLHSDHESNPAWPKKFPPVTPSILTAIMTMLLNKDHVVTIQRNEEGWYIFACCTGSFYLNANRVADPLIHTITKPAQLLVALYEDLSMQQGRTEDASAYPKRISHEG